MTGSVELMQLIGAFRTGATIADISSTSTAASAGEPSPSFAVGQLIDAKILEMTSPQVALSKVGDSILALNLPQPARAGQTLSLQVLSNVSPLQFRLVGNMPVSSAGSTAVELSSLALSHAANFAGGSSARGSGQMLIDSYAPMSAQNIETSLRAAMAGDSVTTALDALLGSSGPEATARLDSTSVVAVAARSDHASHNATSAETPVIRAGAASGAAVETPASLLQTKGTGGASPNESSASPKASNGPPSSVDPVERPLGPSLQTSVGAPALAAKSDTGALPSANAGGAVSLRTPLLDGLPGTATAASAAFTGHLTQSIPIDVRIDPDEGSQDNADSIACHVARLAVELPRLGRVSAQLHWGADGLSLRIAATGAPVDALRAQAGELLASMAGAKLRVSGFRIHDEQ